MGTTKGFNIFCETCRRYYSKPLYSFGRTAISSINPAWIIIKLVAAIPSRLN